MRVEEHLSGKSAIHEHISSCKDCHSSSISTVYAIYQANTDFDAKIKEALYIKNMHQNYAILHKYITVVLNFFLYLLKQCIVLIMSNSIRYFFITVLDVDKLRCKHLKRKM